MEVNECAHSFSEDRVCMLCGMCAEDGEMLQWQYDGTPAGRPASMGRGAYKQEAKHMKYAVPNQFRLLDRVLQKLLVPLELCSYGPRIREVLGTAQFPCRLSPDDKALLVLYHLLVQDGFPITIDDLLSVTRMDKYRFLKAYRGTFQFESEPPAYLRSIFDRVSVVFIEQGIAVKVAISEILRMRQFFVCVSAWDFCAGCIIHYRPEPLPFRFVKIGDRNQTERIRKLVKRLKSQHRLAI